jgi:hypothetical protein
MPRVYGSRNGILDAEDAGFLKTHLSDRLIEGGYEVLSAKRKLEWLPAAELSEGLGRTSRLSNASIRV